MLLMDDHRTIELCLANIVNSVNDAIVSLDENLRIVFLNRAAENLFECTGGTLVGQSVDKCKPLNDVITQLNLTELTPVAGQTKAMRQLEGRRGAGEIFYMEVAVAGARINGLLYFTAIIRDVSQEYKMERALYQSQKTQVVALLARGIAHDFNNILAAILGHLDLVELATDLSASLKKPVHYAQTAARRGAELVNRLVAFTRESETKEAPLDLDRFVGEVVFVLRHSFDRRIKVEHFQDSSPTWLVHADVNQMMQVVLALCLNARDSMPSGGELSIRVAKVQFSLGESAPRKTGDFVRLTIGDTGEGVPQEVVGRMFEPSFTGGEFGKGGGFGLSIAQSMIVAFGGWIEVESVSGRGTQFDVYLPRLLQEVANSEGAVRAEPESSDLDGHEAILLMEHEESLRVVMRSILEYRGYRIVTVATGEEAVEKYVQAQPRFDLVLMDLDMPRSAGWEAVAKIQQHNPAVAIILLSARGVENERAVGLGTPGFLAKPFQNSALVSVVRQTLDRFRKTQKANIPNPSTDQE